MTKVRVLWPNVHTSQGKKFKGDEVDGLPEDEVKMLDDKDAVKIVRTRKKASE